MKNDLPELFSAIRQGCAPALWSRAVELTRISSSLKPLTDVVTLWPQDSTWSCSCTSDEDPCAHVAAAVIAYRNGQTTESEAKAESTARIIYSFTRSAEKLVLNRLIEDGISRSPLNTTLVSYVGGIRTGRISASPVSATNEDFRIDEILASNSGSLDSSTLANLFRQLVHIPHAEYNGSPITISAEPVEFYAKVEEVSGGYFLSRQINAEAMELFSNGAALCVSNSLTSQLVSLATVACCLAEGRAMPLKTARSILWSQTCPSRSPAATRWHTILVKGSGRKTDEYAAKLEDGS